MIYSVSKYLFLSVLLSSVVIFSQTTYYVSPSGNNNNSGLSETDAFATLQHAADIVSAGDSVLAMSGNYAGFDIRTNGTQSHPIVFKAIENNVVIDTRNTVTPDGINIENADWIIIDGFEVKDQPRTGIRIVLSDFVVIRNNYCHNNYRWGILTGFTDDIIIENNICSFSEDEHGIYVSNSSDRPVIRNNHSFGNNGCGIHMNGDISMGGDGIISEAIIEGNILHDNGYGGGSAINMDGVRDSKIFNNLIYNNHATGIAMYRIDGGDASKNNKIYNNTIIQPPDGRWNILVVNGSTGNIVYNNILINNHSFRGSIATDAASTNGFVSDFNILENRLSIDDGNSIMNLSQWQALGYDQNSFIADSEDEIFVNHNSGDFHLLPGSQPVNTGTSLVFPIVIEDLDKVSRPQGISFDIGVYEFIETTNVEENTSVNDFVLYQNYPNPFNPFTTLSFVISHQSFVTLKVYDVVGNEVAFLVNEERQPGTYEIIFDGSNLSSGVYFYTLTSGILRSVKKLILAK